MEFKDNLRALRKKKNLTQLQLAGLLSVDPSTVGKWEQVNYIPSTDILFRLCDILETTMDNLLGREPKVNNVEFIKPTPTIRIPVFGSIPAGKPIEACEDILEHIEIPTSWTKNGQTFFGLRVKGDSMLPEFKEGDTIVLKQQTSCDSGQFAAVSINKTEVTLKKVRRQATGITLQPLNLDYDIIYFTNKEIKELPVTILGVVVEVRRSFK